MTVLVILTSPPGAALLAVVAALGMRFPVRRQAPTVARRIVETFLDDRGWRDEMVYRAKFHPVVPR